MINTDRLSHNVASHADSQCSISNRFNCLGDCTKVYRQLIPEPVLHMVGLLIMSGRHISNRTQGRDLSGRRLGAAADTSV